MNTSTSTSNQPADTRRTGEAPRKRTFVTPQLTHEGSVPRITCGSDIFGDA